MICPKCGARTDDSRSVCPGCGTRLKTDPSAIRQGKAAPSDPPARSGVSRPTGYIPPQPDAPLSERRRPRYTAPAKPDRNEAERPATHKVHRFMINKARLGLILLILFLLAVVAGFVLLHVTDQGQLILARLGRDTSAQALWLWGDEQMEQGYVDKAIETYEKAYRQEPELSEIYDMLKKLAEAYEAAGRTADAEDIFNAMRELKPDQRYSYENIVRLMLAQNRYVEAADFLQLAYDKTGSNSFLVQRTNMLPTVPTASLGGGKYSSVKELELESAEGYDIYYIFGQGELPEEGQLYTGPIRLDEGYYALRAVAISSTLASDELAVNYTVTLPAPAAPYANLAPDTYHSAAVKLKNMNDFDVTIYYTLDNTAPTANSPIYDGTPIVLPGGSQVHLRAVCVDANGKVSNELDVNYEILQKFPNMFRESDTFSGFVLMDTKRDLFVRKYKEPLREEDIEDDAIPDRCIRLVYDWGEARFYSSEKGFTLYHVETTSSSMTGPRSTKVGMSVENITSAFRDMGMPNNQDGTRSLYHDDSVGFGMVYPTGDNSCRIDYVYNRGDDTTLTLSYYAENNRVTRIIIRCSY